MLAFQEIIDADASPDPAQIVGGTLCLMSCAMASLLNSVLDNVPIQDAAGCHFFYVKRIADNLSLLGNDVNLDPHFRRLCKRLCELWETKLDLIREPAISKDSRSSQTKPCASIVTKQSSQPHASAPAHAPTPAPAPMRAITDALAASVRIH